MTRRTIQTITSARLARWAAFQNGRHATPAVLISVGHDHASGELVVQCCEDMTDDQLAALLFGALEHLGYTRPPFREPPASGGKEGDK